MTTHFSIDLKKLLLSLILPVLIIFFRPMSLTLEQSIILGTLLFTIVAWVNGALHKSLTSIIALTLFLIFGQLPITDLFQFPLSSNFLLIVFSFVFSKGISNSHLADILIQPLLMRYTKSRYQLVGVTLLLAFIMIFVIPQPFSRVIILSHIFNQFYTKTNIAPKDKSILLFSVFLFSMLINMTLIRGDIILNNALITMSGLAITEAIWIKYMALPVLIYCFICIMMFLLIFRDTFKNYEALAKEHTYMSKPKMDQRNKRDLIIILFMLIVWATEEFHGVGGTYVVVISTFLMIPLKLVGKKDIQAINYHLLIFLTAAFSIGPVMTFSGLADIIFSKFTGLFPTSFSLVYAFVILAVAVVLHLILGSNVTTMSVVIPGLMTVSSGIVSPIIVIFLIFVAICGHFILPFHNVLLLLGNGSGYYDNKPVIKYGLFLFPVMLLSVFFIFLPWWQYMSSF